MCQNCKPNIKLAKKLLAPKPKLRSPYEGAWPPWTEEQRKVLAGLRPPLTHNVKVGSRVTHRDIPGEMVVESLDESRMAISGALYFKTTCGRSGTMFPGLPGVTNWEPVTPLATK